MGVFGSPIVESENDVAIFLGFYEVDVWTIGNKERGEMGVVGDAFIEESFLVGGASVCLIFCENEDAGYQVGSGGRMDNGGNGRREVDDIVGKQF